jgi:Family of unknown function (DUF5681)
MARDFEVGYGKPPRGSQWGKGQSGNPNGRPKGAQNLTTDLMDELQQKVIVTEGGRPLTLTKQRVLAKAIVAKAMKGDARAFQTIQATVERRHAAEANDVTEDLSVDDQMIMDLLQSRQKTQSSS